MAAISIQDITDAGLTPALVAAEAGGDTLAANGQSNVFLEIRNDGGAAITVTITTPQTVNGLAVEDRVLTVNAGARVLSGPFPAGLYGSNVAINYSAVTSVTVGAFRI